MHVIPSLFYYARPLLQIKRIFPILFSFPNVNPLGKLGSAIFGYMRINKRINVLPAYRNVSF
jgi:hypothetical protein